ncbi:MAG: hypothetical protein ACJAWS_000120 [Oleiphilaceae bacterium]|jgi:hypothetical protein|uniref:hypothetical protein n=1 Tax=Alteromonadales TaxID=135622 RepID=UPI000A174CA6|nr:hypothetical protein [Colwellia polaris]|tara:strand:+ start:2160 stop:3032 length:873 start_codon:yes stop_codon:yes gene_type:complete
MKKYKTVIQQDVTELVCDGCGLEAHVHKGYEFSEFISIEHKCGYGTIHGDGKKLSIDLCQHCFADMCSDSLTIVDPLDEKISSSNVDKLEYQNIFQAITRSKHEVNELKQGSDIRITARDILSANQISSPNELQAAMKRVEQLWDAQYQSAEGNELHQLADLICAYEKKDWDSFFEEDPLADDDFMPGRLNFKPKCTFDEDKTASGMLSSILINTEVDDESSRDSVLVDNALDETKQYLLESIANAMHKHPELRLGQLLMNALSFQQSSPELFYIEDDVLTEKISQFSWR